MRNSFYTYLMLSVIAVSGVAYATGVPVRGRGEIVNMMTDKDRSNDDHMIVRTHGKVMDEVIGITGGPETFSSDNAQEELANTLVSAKDVFTEEKRNFVKTIEEKMGEPLKPCGENAEKFVKQIDALMVYPATQKEREKISEEAFEKLTTERKKAIENAATAGLARAWIAEKEASDVAESLPTLVKELGSPNMDSQMDAMVQILRLQEEAFKNMNTRTTLMAEELKNTGLAALEGNM